jgi:hypothetical protein
LRKIEQQIQKFFRKEFIELRECFLGQDWRKMGYPDRSSREGGKLYKLAAGAKAGYDSSKACKF